MKSFVILLLLAAALRAPAVENFLSGAATTNSETHIESDSVDFDMKSRQAIYHGHVRVQDPRVSMTCDLLTARIPAEGKRIDSIIAETNVVMLIPDKGVTNRATSSRAVYTWQISGGKTNETLELTGLPMPSIETPQGTLTGDTIVWDRGSDTLRATNQKMIYRPGAEPSTNNVPTNSVPTNSVAAESKPAAK
jgi:lipopolysaccharide transport protein LptA